jgi:ABC-2 type transport system permease protein
MMRALEAEIAKLRHATLPAWTVLVVFVAPFMSGAMASGDREWLKSLSWSDFLGMGTLNMATWYGILLFGLMAAFLFGREYAEGVAPNALTVPMRRELFVLAKLMILAVWAFALAVLSVVAQGVWATALGHTGFAWSAVYSAFGDTFQVALLIFFTLPVVALVAVVSRSVFAPMIFSALGFSVGMIGGVAGWGEWLPWAMPAAIGGTFLEPLGASGATSIGAGSWAIAATLFVVGVAALLYWVNHADSTS